MKPLHYGAGLLLAALAASAQTETNKPPTPPLTGTVVDIQGRPVPGAIVEFYESGANLPFRSAKMEPSQRATVGTNGSFEFRGSRESLMLVARTPGLAPAWASVNRGSGGEQRLVLVSPGTLAGVVVDETDRPLAGAEVYVAVALADVEQEHNGMRRVSLLFGTPARTCFNARTAADGRFRIEGFPTNAGANLTIKAPGKILRQPIPMMLGPDTMQCRAGDQDIRLVVEQAGSIEGKVIAGETGQPMAAARLTLNADSPGFIGFEELEPTLSGADGAFRINDVAAGSYRLGAVFDTNTVPEWVAAEVLVSVDAGQPTREVQVSAIRGGFLEVKVLRKADHKPLAQASVSVRQQGFYRADTSDNNGVALLRLLPGSYQVFAYNEGWTTANSSATVETGTTNRIEIELVPAPRITGIVRRPDGQPAAGLPVRIVGGFSAEDANSKTDAAGRFDMPWGMFHHDPMGTTCCLLIRDAEHNLAIAQDIDEDTGPLDLRLAPGLTFAGRAECDGKPVTNVSASLIFWTGRSGAYLNGLATGTNFPGHFEIPALPPGRRYGINVTAPGYGQHSLDNPGADEEAKRIELDPVELRPASLKLAGQVVDADDKPVARANVNLQGDDQPFLNVRTDREGRFTFDHVCEGTARLYASAARLYGNISAEGGDTNVILKLGESHNIASGSSSKPQKLKGTVTGPDGQPAAGAQVAVFPFGELRWVKTGTNGTFNYSSSRQPWQSGKSLLIARDIARHLAAAEELPEDATNLNVQLKPAVTLAGRVEGADHAPLAKAEVGAWLRVGNTSSQLDEQPTATDAEGRFEIKSLPATERYTVSAKARGYGRSQQEVPADAETKRVELPPFVLKIADKILAGQVMNRDDRPVAGVRVSLSGNDQPQDSATTDSKGRFTLKVCAGKVHLSASSQSGYASATAEAGDTNIVLQLAPFQSSAVRPAVRRPSLKGKPLPDLAALGLAPEAVPAGRPLLLCLFDLEQRPSRRIVRLLAEQHDALRQKGLTVVAVQAAVATPEALQTWKDGNPVPFPVGRVAEKSGQTKWASDVESMPWLILTDAERRVTAEGFPLEELEAKAQALSK